jgi:hypothetical protein
MEALATPTIEVAGIRRGRLIVGGYGSLGDLLYVLVDERFVSDVAVVTRTDCGRDSIQPLDHDEATRLEGRSGSVVPFAPQGPTVLVAPERE